MIRVLFDTNVLLDALLLREPFFLDAAFLLKAIDAGKLEGFVSATTMTDVHYLTRKHTKSSTKAIEAVTTLLSSMQICSVTRGVLEQAVALGGSDFEDAVQIACAIAMNLDSIVTRDVSGFKVSPITVLDPTALKRSILEADDQPMIDDELSLNQSD